MARNDDDIMFSVSEGGEETCDTDMILPPEVVEEEQEEIVTLPPAPRPQAASRKTSRSRSPKEAPKQFSLYNIFGGDVFHWRGTRKAIPYIFLVTLVAVLYVANRYASQQETLQIDNLQDTLQMVQYDALSCSSVLLERTRQSKIIEYLNQNSDSSLITTTVPPYVIN